ENADQLVGAKLEGRGGKTKHPLDASAQHVVEALPALWMVLPVMDLIHNHQRQCSWDPLTKRRAGQFPDRRLEVRSWMPPRADTLDAFVDVFDHPWGNALQSSQC